MFVSPLGTVGVEDVDLVQMSVQEILKASVMAEVDVISQPLTRLLDAAKERAASLPALIPAAFYLPAPPLYCPQPSPNTQVNHTQRQPSFTSISVTSVSSSAVCPSPQDSVRDAALVLERESRCQVSGLVQKVLMLFRAAHSSRPAAQWYISSLHRCRHLLQKVCYPYLTELINDYLAFTYQLLSNLYLTKLNIKVTC